MTTAINIKIVSDTVCPWCYVGKKRLERGISLFRTAHPNQPVQFNTTWSPFYLDPTAPLEGEDKQERYARRFGSQRTAMMFQRLAQIGKDEGIDFKFGGRTGNTRDSHRLVQLGKTKGSEMQTRVIEELFAAYFENERDITSRDVLREAGLKAGLEEKEVEQWLGSDEGGEAVDKEVEEAQEGFISGVPYFSVEGRYHLEGAQEPEAFVDVFERILTQKGEKADGKVGESC
ncbi:hypothetical protein LTS18_012247 [Coniosporium uncinatum]|uniref:Uncharacterized protein n=1 Tax=Coniosporium uncinatum TaxID=93489 RepID=A0ACC3DJ47_9PEZI|nr:hypothetical protein LTS18_012247 [Coniosporium uncinatum]